MKPWIAKTSAKSSRMRHAFTLIELLVVVAIIALLMAILLPSLAQARANAKRVSCASNMRAIGSAFGVYVSEWDGVLPPNYFNASEVSSTYYATWAWALSKATGRTYMDWMGMTYPQAAAASLNPNLRMWRCPENMKQVYACDPSGGERATSYGANTWNAASGTTFAAYDGRYLSTKDEKVKFTAFAAPSELYAVIEATYYRTEMWYDDGGATRTDDTGRSIPFVPAGITYARYPHNMAMNILYADGHVETAKSPLRGRGSVKTGVSGGLPDSAQKWTNGYHWWAQ